MGEDQQDLRTGDPVEPVGPGGNRVIRQEQSVLHPTERQEPSRWSLTEGGHGNR